MTIRGECEAMRIVRDLALADASCFDALRVRAKQLTGTLATPAGELENGRPCAIPPWKLRDMARLHTVSMTHRAIAEACGVSRWLVRYHLKPSRAMINACLSEGKA